MLQCKAQDYPKPYKKYSKCYLPRFSSENVYKLFSKLPS